MVCNAEGKDCVSYSDAEFYRIRRESQNAHGFTGSRDFEFIFETRRRTAPIPTAVAVGIGGSALIGATGGAAAYALGPSAGVTTLGIGGAAAARAVPPYVRRVLNHIKNTSGRPPPGYRGGRTFRNDGREGDKLFPRPTVTADQ